MSVKDAEQTQEEAEAELLEACKQFEAYLWEQVLKGMEKTAKMFSDDEDETQSRLPETAAYFILFPIFAILQFLHIYNSCLFTLSH